MKKLFKTWDKEEEEMLLKRELRLRLFSHPNIIQYKDHFLSKEEEYCIILEYANGKSHFITWQYHLRNYLKRKTQVPKGTIR